MSVEPYDSCLWKSLVDLRQNLDKMSYWKLGNNKTIRVWEDAWVAPGLKLMDHVLHQPTLRNSSSYMAEHITLDGCWN